MAGYRMAVRFFHTKTEGEIMKKMKIIGLLFSGCGIIGTMILDVVTHKQNISELQNYGYWACVCCMALGAILLLINSSNKPTP